MEVGKLFSSAEEAIKCVQAFAKANYHPLRQRNNKTVETYNKQVSVENQLPLSLKYQCLHWECKHHGTHKSSGTGKRSVVRTYAMKCPVEITIPYNRATGKFWVKVLKLEHQNHSISKEMYELYPDNRRPTGLAAEEADQMLQVNGNPTLVAKTLHEKGFKVKRKDIYNRKSKLLKMTGLNHTAQIEEVLVAVGADYRLLTNGSNEFEALFFQTPQQRVVFSKYSEVLQMDATYKTNRQRYSLFTLLIEDGNGLGQPVAFALMAREDANHISKFLEYFAENNAMEGTHAIVTDKDMAEINAVTDTWPNVKLVLCYFHVLRAIDRHLSASNGYSSSDKGRCCELAKGMLNARSEMAFKESLVLMQSEQPEFFTYVQENWIPFAKNIVLFHQQKLRLLNNRTNNRLESFHDTLKKVLPSSQLSLGGLIQVLLRIMDVQTVEGAHRKFASSLKVAVVSGGNPAVARYYSEFSAYCARMIADELEKAEKKSYHVVEGGELVHVTNVDTQATYYVKLEHDSPCCSCALPTTCGVPCRHMFAIIQTRGNDCFRPDLVAARWKLPSVDDGISSLPTPAIQEARIQVSSFPLAAGTRISRFQSAMISMKEVASFFADRKASEFAGYMESLTLFKRLAFNTDVDRLRAMLLSISAEETESATRENQQDSTSDGHIEDTPADINSQLLINEDDLVNQLTHSAEDHEALQATEDPDTREPPSAASTAAANVVFVAAPRTRGRPVITRQRAFKVFGRQSRVVRNTSENCSECGYLEPPREVSRAKKIAWIKCETCQFWYHKCCVDRKARPKKNQAFLCKRCITEV